MPTARNNGWLKDRLRILYVGSGLGNNHSRLAPQGLEVAARGRLSVAARCRKNYKESSINHRAPEQAISGQQSISPPHSVTWNYDMGTKIVSVGYKFPSFRVTNDMWQEQFAPKTKLMSNEFTRFISEGAEQRFYMMPGDTVDELGAHAALDCLERINFPPDEVEHIIHMANVPDTLVNGEGPKIQHRIGATRASTMDLTGVSCSGFVLGLNMAVSLIETGCYNNVLITCVANVGTRAADHRDVSAATLGQKTDKPAGKLGFVHQTRGEHYHVHMHKVVEDGKRTWKEDEEQHWGKHFFFIDPRKGVLAAQKAVHEFVPNAARLALERAGKTINDVQCLLTHQPGLASLRAWDKALNIDEKIHPNTMSEIGNSSTCTIPFTLCRTLEKGAIKDDDIILFMTPGSGQHVAALVWKW
jgi:3-oxoacyl-[acyl-carrier-protein] synthase-3